ncbi:MAG: CopG family transcriptional regulator [Cellulomonadaceae bacterium]|jgi:hypothetical protein|nr:CopG family transcriptional regulator [Cellulomonadaceae bacterium]
MTKPDRVYTTASGATFTEADVEQWGTEADNGFEGWEFGPSRPGRPLSVGSDTAEPITIRLDSNRRRKLDTIAAQHHVSRAQVVRELIDAA